MNRSSPMALLFILLTVAFTVIGQLLIKQGMLEVGASPTQVAMLPRFAYRNQLKVLIGLACAVAAALSWIVAISRSDLSFAYPFMGLAIVPVLSERLFGENAPINRWLGVLIVCLGLLIATRG